MVAWARGCTLYCSVWYRLRFLAGRIVAPSLRALPEIRVLSGAIVAIWVEVVTLVGEM